MAFAGSAPAGRIGCVRASSRSGADSRLGSAAARAGTVSTSSAPRGRSAATWSGAPDTSANSPGQQGRHPARPKARPDARLALAVSGDGGRRRFAIDQRYTSFSAFARFGNGPMRCGRHGRPGDLRRAGRHQDGAHLRRREQRAIALRMPCSTATAPVTIGEALEVPENRCVYQRFSTHHPARRRSRRS